MRAIRRAVQAAGIALMAALAAEPGAAGAAEHLVRMSGSAYAPAAIAARVGDTIRFINDDFADHVVLVPTSAFAVDLGTQKPGEERTLPLAKAGRFAVECVIHPEMTATVTVGP